MSKLLDFSDAAFCPGGSIYTNPKDLGLFLSHGSHVDVYFPPRKRTRVSAPIVLNEIRLEKKQTSIDVLPDECLFEVFRRLASGQEKSACASVSKRWLMLLSNIRKDEFCTRTSLPPEKLLERDVTSEEKKKGELAGSDETSQVEDLDSASDGYLTRSLEGKKATDIRLAAISVGTASRGGLGKLLIRGCNPTRGVTDLGLKSIAQGCPSLRVLSIWKVSSIGDEGISAIANGCSQLEKLDLCQCPAISDQALLAVAKGCPNLTDLTIESCSNIGDEGLKAVSQSCPKLKSVTIKDCPRVGDQGIVNLFSSASYALEKVNLHSLSISDVSLAVIGHYGKAVTDLVLNNLQNVSERGFWVMGNGHGLQKLKVLTVTSCQGLTDAGLEAVGKGCPNLKQFCLRRCAYLSDNGLASFTKCAGSLEIFQLEECHRITQCGVFAGLVNCSLKLKSLMLANCLGFKDVMLQLPPLPPCKLLRSLCIRSCPGFGDTTLSILGKMCPQLLYLELTGLHGITDAGLSPLIESCESGLVRVNLSSCVNITNVAVSNIVKLHGGTLDLLNLDGCKMVTDSSLIAIAENCSMLSDLDVSKCSVTDFGIAALACGMKSRLQILSVSGCSLITDKSISFLFQMGQALSGLNLQHCNGFSKSKVNLLANRLWRCDVLA